MGKWTWLRNIRNSKESFNIDDFNNGNKFFVVDDNTNEVYSLCKKEVDGYKYLDIPKELQNEEFIEWLIDCNYEVFLYLEKKCITIDILSYILYNTINLSNNIREELFKNITPSDWVSVMKKNPSIFSVIPRKYLTEELKSTYKLGSNGNACGRINCTVSSVTKRPQNKSEVQKNKYNIKLNTILGFFKNEELAKVLSKNGINTLRDFLIKLNEEKISYLLSTSYSNYMDFKATVSLLRCKYLGIDPKIKVFDIELISLINKLGLSSDIESKLYNIGYSYDYKGFIMEMAEMSLDERINYFVNKSNMNNIEIEQLVYRLEILIDFYKVKHKVLVNRLSQNRGK